MRRQAPNTAGSMGNSNAMSAVKTWLRDTYTEHRFQKAERIPRSKKRMDAVILVLAGVSVLLFVYEWTSSTYPAILNQLSILLDLIFLLDYLLRLYFSGAQGQDGFTWTKASNHYAYRWYGIVDWIVITSYSIHYTKLYDAAFRFCRF